MMFWLTDIRTDHRLGFQKELKKAMNSTLVNSKKLNYTYLRRQNRAKMLFVRSRTCNQKKYKRKTNDIPYPVRITSDQVDNLPDISSSFRIVSFRSLVLFFLLLGLGFFYQNVSKKEAVSGKNLLLESLLGTSFLSLSLLVTPEKSFRLRALS